MQVRHSLRMQLVEGSIHAHCHFERVQPTIFSYFVHHSSHACAAELGCPPRHHSAHLLDNDAVVTSALKPQVVQDRSDLQQGQAVTGVGGRQQVVSQSHTKRGRWPITQGPGHRGAERKCHWPTRWFLLLNLVWEPEHSAHQTIESSRV